MVVNDFVRNTLHEHATGQRFKQGERKLSLSLLCSYTSASHSAASIIGADQLPHCDCPLCPKLRNELLEDA
jgi:hypothetical protein